MIFLTAGDTGAKKKTDRITEAVQKYYSEIVAYCRCHLNYNRPLAEECAQDVFAAFLQCDASSEIRHIRAWLYRTADNYLNRTIRALEKEKSHTCPWSPDEAESRLFSETDFDRFLEPNVDIEKNAREILDSLDPDERRLYTLYFREHRRVDELAPLYGISSAAMKSRIHRLKLRLMIRIHKMFGEETGH